MIIAIHFISFQIYKSRDELVEWARARGKANGFVIVIKMSDVGVNGRKPRITLACERSGYFRPSKKVNDKNVKKREATGSKKCRCPFELKGKKNFLLGMIGCWKSFVKHITRLLPTILRVIHL